MPFVLPIVAGIVCGIVLFAVAVRILNWRAQRKAELEGRAHPGAALPPTREPPPDDK